MVEAASTTDQQLMNGTKQQAASMEAGADDGLTHDEREAQRRYWQEHTPQQPTVETMMLDSKAGEIDRRERPEVLGLLGSVSGARVLELGAGIGRFTGELCRAGAEHVLAVDFMAASIAENKRLHGHLYPGQLDFMVEDATQLQLPERSLDVCFTNWLLMYLGDKEVAGLAARMLTWLTPGGVVFFRESCFKQSGDKPRKDNPTHYRNPKEYFHAFDSIKYTCPQDGQTYQFELLFSKCVDTYVVLKNNQNQICWKWRKVAVPADGCSHALRHFLDGAQYSMTGLALYEAVYGRGFISCGGEAAARALIPRLGLQRGHAVLDVGCGVGGAAHLMSTQWGAAVHGLDLSVNCLLTCLERASNTGNDIVYEVADITTRHFPAATFNAVHCRDVLLHVEDKAALLHRFHDWLAPGGRVLITDYAVSNNSSGTDGAPTHANGTAAKGQQAAADNSSPHDLAGSMQQYVAQRRYSLWSPEQYQSALQAAGFVDVTVEDMTDQLVAHLTRELDGLHQQQEQLAAQHGEEAVQSLIHSWQAKLARAQGGAQRWVLVLAAKGDAQTR